MTRPRDTTEDAHRVQIEVLRRLGPVRRVELALEMSDESRRASLDGIRRRHPEYTDEEARHALFRLLHGDATFRAAWPGRPLLDP